MSLLYRTVVAAPGAALIDGVGRSFKDWLSSKGIDLEVPGSGSISDGPTELSVASVDDGGTRALRLVLHEDRTNERWSTTITAIEDGTDPVVWIDLERVSTDPYGRPPIVAVPRIVESVLNLAPCFVGPTRLRTEPELVQGSVEALVNDLVDEDRRVPLIVISKDRYTSVEDDLDRGQQMLKRVLGLAPVFVLDGAASSALEQALGNDLHVYGGAVRCYLPELSIPDRLPKRHPYIAGTVFGSQTANAASRIQRSLTQQAISQRPPLAYTERISKLPGFPHHQGSTANDEELVADLVEVEAERDGLQRKLLDLQDEVEFAALQLDEAESELDSAQARVRYLEGRLRIANDQAANEPTPASSVPETAETCLEVVGYARQYLEGVDVGDTDYHASALDTFAKSGSWARKAWRALRAMEDYADLKTRGEFAGDFLSYCSENPHGRTVIPAGWVALKESESTDNNPKYRGARTFPVPADVDEDEEIYMNAHIKIEAGGKPAPRIHFHDDTAGTTGLMHIGYFGEHLPNDQTN